MVTVRPLRPGDEAAVAEIFWATLRLGSRLDGVARIGRYEDLCLGWYLGPGRDDVRLLVDGERPLGYVLVGARPAEYERWVRWRAAGFAVFAVASLGARRHTPATARFLRLRLADGWALRRSPRPLPVHAHLNLLPGARGGTGARLLASHVDDVCRRVGSSGWYGEVNAPAGRRAAALERLGGRVVHRAPNRTLTALLGHPVERLTVVRDLGTSMGVVS